MGGLPKIKKGRAKFKKLDRDWEAFGRGGEVRNSIG